MSDFKYVVARHPFYQDFLYLIADAVGINQTRWLIPDPWGRGKSFLWVQHTHTHVRTHRYTHTHTHTHICTPRHTCRHADTHIYTHKHTDNHTYTQPCICTNTNTYTCTNTHKHSCTHRHTCTQRHTHTCTRTNIQSLLRTVGSRAIGQNTPLILNKSRLQHTQRNDTLPELVIYNARQDVLITKIHHL